MQDFRVAAVCMRPAAGEIWRNLERLRELAGRAAAAGADVVCFPELCLSGYVLDRPEEACGGMAAVDMKAAVVEVAREAGVVLVAGMIEPVQGEKPYITQVVAGPGGVMGLHRKTHLSPAEKGAFQAGQSVSLYPWDRAVFGIQLCYETHFPELATAMALEGMDVLLAPHASPRGSPSEKRSSWIRHLPARAFDNAVFVVACNQVGSGQNGLAFPGVVLVLDPLGRILASYTGCQEKMVLVDLKAARLLEVRRHRMRYFLPHRREELYRRLREG